jgi:hypothetical protein
LNGIYQQAQYFGRSFSKYQVNGDNYVAYCFAYKQGYSKFGSYVGNANANGTFVYLGFKPAFVMIKRTMLQVIGILDNKRERYNLM